MLSLQLVHVGDGALKKLGAPSFPLLMVVGAFWSSLSTSDTGEERSVPKMDNVGWTYGWASHLCWDAYKR